jgi:hypothetical protein
MIFQDGESCAGAPLLSQILCRQVIAFFSGLWLVYGWFMVGL